MATQWATIITVILIYFWFIYLFDLFILINFFIGWNMYSTSFIFQTEYSSFWSFPYLGIYLYMRTIWPILY